MIPMKKHPCRFVAAVLILAATSLFAGCAQMVDVLNATANELERQRLESEYAAYYAAYNLPRPASDTSAPGIK
jgi:hypothetical protein